MARMLQNVIREIIRPVHVSGNAHGFTLHLSNKAILAFEAGNSAAIAYSRTGVWKCYKREECFRN